MSLTYRRIEPGDNARIAEIICTNLKKHHLDIPGTAYFDPELENLCAYYNVDPEKRVYFIAMNPDGKVVGGVGAAEYPEVRDCAELQKLYLDDSVKGHGYGKELILQIENWANEAGYEKLYLETHTNLDVALKLYERVGFYQVARPKSAIHGTMNRFYMKDLI